jgi:hypothetical protein
MWSSQSLRTASWKAARVGLAAGAADAGPGLDSAATASDPSWTTDAPPSTSAITRPARVTAFLIGGLLCLMGAVASLPVLTIMHVIVTEAAAIVKPVS